MVRCDRSLIEGLQEQRVHCLEENNHPQCICLPVLSVLLEGRGCHRAKVVCDPWVDKDVSNSLLPAPMQHSPAFAMTTSNQPTLSATSLATAFASSSLELLNFKMWRRPSVEACSCSRASALVGSLQVAKTLLVGSEVNFATRPNPMPRLLPVTSQVVWGMVKLVFVVIGVVDDGTNPTGTCSSEAPPRCHAFVTGTFEEL